MITKEIFGILECYSEQGLCYFGTLSFPSGLLLPIRFLIFAFGFIIAFTIILSIWNRYRSGNK